MAEWVVRKRAAVVAVWGLVLLALLPGAARLPARLDPSTRIVGSGSVAMERALQAEFASPLAHPLVLVVRGLPAPDAEATRAALAPLLPEIRSVRGVRTVIPEDGAAAGPGARLEPGSAVFLVGIDSGGAAAAPILARLRAVTAPAVRRLSGGGRAVTLRWTGLDATSLDLRRASARDARRSELRAAVPTLLLLVIAFRSLVAAAVPLGLGVLAIVAGMGLVSVLSPWWAPSLLLQNVISILGLALGVDYALLVVTRFRECLGTGESSRTAAARTAGTAGKTIILSGATVALGFVALLLVRVDEIRSVAVGGIAVVFAAVLLATTLLPAVLSWIGAGIDRGRLGRGRMEAGSRWHAWGGFVTRHPVPVLAAAALPLLLLAWPARRLSTDVPRDWLPSQMESARGLADLADLGRDDLFNATTVLLRLPGGAQALAEPGWEATNRLSGRLLQDPRVARVQSLPTLAAGFGAPRELFTALLPDSVRRLFVSRDGTVALLNVRPRHGASLRELAEFVRAVRRLDAGQVTGMRGAELLVGGAPAVQADYEDAVAASFPRVIATVLLGILLALSVGFRSLMIPLKATVLNLVSVGAAFGALVLVFQDGWGSGLFGIAGPLEGVFPAVPVLVFAIVFGVSMDYEVFLLRRVAEERGRPGASESSAIVDGLTRTARVITSAAVIMVTIFAALIFGSYLPARLLGFALAVAVLLDATLVRLALGPALLRLAGRWNWWPGGGRATRARPAAKVAQR